MITDSCSTGRPLFSPKQINYCSTRPTSCDFVLTALFFPRFPILIPGYLCPFERSRFARRMTTLPTWHQQSRRECLMIMVIRTRLQYRRLASLELYWLGGLCFLIYLYTPSIICLSRSALCRGLLAQCLFDFRPPWSYVACLTCRCMSCLSISYHYLFPYFHSLGRSCKCHVQFILCCF